MESSSSNFEKLLREYFDHGRGESVAAHPHASQPDRNRQKTGTSHPQHNPALKGENNVNED